MPRLGRHHVSMFLLGCAIPLLLRAQGVTAPDSARLAGPIRTDLVLINPFGAVFDVISGEYEHVLSRGATIGFAGTYYAPSDFKYFTTEIKLRYYPSERAPDGFSAGLSAGVTHVSGELLCFDVCDQTSVNRPTVGFDLDYNWLLGPSRRFTIGTGIGAKRFFGNKQDGSLDGVPTGRLALGIAF
jgi:hypothetical protein